MSSSLPQPGPAPAFAQPAYAENVMPHAQKWSAAGERVCLVTLTGIDGSAPRPIGAQMAVSETGKAVGYLSGGCLEAALVAEARGALAEGRNRMVRYGAGSPYLDIELPCGGGLDVYIDQAVAPDAIAAMAALTQRRRPYVLRTHLPSGASTVAELMPREDRCPATGKGGEDFVRVYLPAPRLVVFGRGPAAGALASLAQTSGFPVALYTPDEDIAAACDAQATLMTVPGRVPDVALDAWTGVTCLFHDHAWEPELLARALRSEAFHVAAMGSYRAQMARREALAGLGVREDQIARLHAPAGLIPGAKSPPEIALSMLAGFAAEAKTRGFLW